MCLVNTLSNYIEENNIDLIVYKMSFAKGAAMRDKIDGSCAIFYDDTQITTTAEMNEVLAHEAGHCATGAFHDTASEWDIVEKHEEKAIRWAIEKCIPFPKLCALVRHGITEQWLLAEQLEVPESMVQKAVYYYTQVLGMTI